jgi:hypothetical protein
MALAPPLSVPVRRATCLNHPRREAAARCTSCGQPFCRECVTELEGRMVCGACYRERAQTKEKPKRDWFVLTTALQAICGFAALWFTAWLLGEVLVNVKSNFHEGSFWESLAASRSGGK